MKTNKPKILSVRIEHCNDVDPDTSHLGEYSQSPNDYAIDREERGDMGRHELQYFNPNWVNYKGVPAEEARQYMEADYLRMEALQRGDWHYLGVIAKAEVQLTGPLTQTIRSGGLWGIESDSGKDYLASVAKEELASLRAELEAIGFGSRAISYAFGKVETVQK